MIAVILAAGMGNRYGGLKQIDPLGPSGEFIIDYSAYDAMRAGFDEVVFIIKRENQALFQETIGKRMEGKISVRYAYQDPNDLPEGLSYPAERQKPLGTTHALYCCRNVVKDSFAIFNADDFYGFDAFRTVKAFMDQAKPTQFCMPGYVVRNTLSENGSVTRGICQTKDGCLTEIVERKKILPDGDHARYEEDGKWVSIDGETPVSMNFWGFTPDIFAFAERRLRAFLTDPKTDLLHDETCLPDLVDDVVHTPPYSIQVLPNHCLWKGVTYQQDRAAFCAYLEQQVRDGKYPNNLWAGVSPTARI